MVGGQWRHFGAAARGELTARRAPLRPPGTAGLFHELL